jgi:hypothetical protein
MNGHALTITDVPCDVIHIGERHRKDMGDLDALASSIAREGLLQPIGITEENELVFGERRLMAVRDLLEWPTIAARVVRVSSILAGEFAENEVRKDFTLSERVAIGKAIEAEIGNRQGQRTDIELPQNFAEVEPGMNPAEHRQTSTEIATGAETREMAAKIAGFGNRTTYEQAKKVVDHGTEEVVERMDSGRLAVSTAALVAAEPPERQHEIATMPEAEQKDVVRKLRKKDPKPTKARNLAEETSMPSEQRQTSIEKSNTLVANDVMEAITALNQCSLAPADVAGGIRDLDTPDTIEQCRKAATFLSQVERELNKYECK